jgi:outer membrane protein OmpA-like peptidoglycan-associated protein
VEFNFAAQLLPQLTVDGSIDYKHAVWLDYFNSTYAAFTGGATNFNGNAIARVPDLTGSFQAIWRDHLVGDWDYYVRGQMTYQGGMYESDIDIGRTASFERVNGSIGVQEGDLTLELYVINLTNDKNWDWASRVPELENAADLFVGGYEEFQGVLVGAPDKRDFGFKVHYKFGAPEAASVAPAAYVPPPVQTAKPATTARSYMVFFDFNKSDLTSQAVSIVDQAAANAGPAKVTQLVVTGHTDTVGSDAYNMRLSRRRAESVAAELEKKGIPSSEIEIVAKGKKDLLVPTADGVREPQNRRVQIVYEGGATS